MGWIVLCTTDFQSVGRRDGLEVRRTAWGESRHSFRQEKSAAGNRVDDRVDSELVFLQLFVNLVDRISVNDSHRTRQRVGERSGDERPAEAISLCQEPLACTPSRLRTCGLT